MARQTNFRNRPAVAPQRRKRVWSREVFGPQTIAQQGVELFRPFINFRAAGGDTLGGTVGAVRMAIRMETVVAGTDNSNAYVIAGRISDEDVNASINGPLTAPHSDWFIWCPIIVGNSVGDSAGTTPGQECVFNSMRKMEELASDFVLVIEGDDNLAAAELKLVISTLLLLP